MKDWKPFEIGSGILRTRNDDGLVSGQVPRGAKVMQPSPAPRERREIREVGQMRKQDDGNLDQLGIDVA